VVSLKGLVSIRKGDVLSFHGCGKGAWREIQDLQRRAQPVAEVESCDPEVEFLASEPAGPESLKELPLFRVSAPAMDLRISPCELHDSWLPDLPIRKLPASGPPLYALKLHGIRRLGQLLMTSGRSLLELKGFGKRSLAVVRGAAAHAVLGRIPEDIDLDAVVPPVVPLPPELEGEQDCAESVPEEAIEPVEEEPLSPFEGMMEDIDPYTRRALTTLRVSDLRDIYDLRPEQVLDSKGFGLSTWYRITKLRELIAQEAPEVLPARDTWSRPASEEALIMLPLFTCFKPSGLNPADLHETYLPDVPVKYLFLTRRPAKLGSWTIGKLLLTSGSALTAGWFFGRASFKALQEALKAAILVPMMWPDISRPSALLDALLSHAVEWERNAEIVRLRVGLTTDDEASFAELSGRYGITRQAVHHAFHKTMAFLKAEKSLRLLAPLWFRVDAAIEERESMPWPNELVDEFVGQSAEDRAREVRALEFLLRLRGDEWGGRMRRPWPHRS
jgi:hypothetical protein